MQDERPHQSSAPCPLSRAIPLTPRTGHPAKVPGWVRVLSKSPARVGAVRSDSRLPLLTFQHSEKAQIPSRHEWSASEVPCFLIVIPGLTRNRVFLVLIPAFAGITSSYRKNPF